MAALLSSKSVLTRGKDEVYVAAVPLRATKGLGQLFMSKAYSLNIWDLQHFMVIIKPNSPSPNSKPVVFGFQPKDPENIYTALAVISGRATPGEAKQIADMTCFAAILFVLFKEQYTQAINLGKETPAISSSRISKQPTGVVLVKQLTKLPKSRCWSVGSSGPHSVNLATKFGDRWDMDLRVGYHDCRDYAEGLVELLTGEMHVLERLRTSNVEGFRWKTK